MTSSRRLLDYSELTRACFLAGQNATVEEIAQDIEVADHWAIRQCLKLYNIEISAKPFGFRSVAVSLSPAQVDGLREVARKQGIVGSDSHQKLAEQAMRRLAADPDLLKAVLDPRMKPIFVDANLMNDLAAEANTRGMQAAALAGSLLDVIVKDSIYNAIIDDGGEE